MWLAAVSFLQLHHYTYIYISTITYLSGLLWVVTYHLRLKHINMIPSNYLFAPYFFSGPLCILKITHTTISPFAWHTVTTGLLSTGNKYFLVRKINTQRTEHGASSAFETEGERRVTCLYGESISDISEQSQRYSGTCCTQNFHR